MQGAPTLELQGSRQHETRAPSGEAQAKNGATLAVEPDTAGRLDLRFLAHLARLGAVDLHPLGRAATDALIARLDPRPGQRVLAVGCGTGGAMVRLARLMPSGAGPRRAHARIDGIDVLPAMRRLARKRLWLAGLSGKAAVYGVKPGGHFPFPDASYDRVYTESVLGMQDAASASALL